MQPRGKNQRKHIFSCATRHPVLVVWVMRGWKTSYWRPQGTKQSYPNDRVTLRHQEGGWHQSCAAGVGFVMKPYGFPSLHPTATHSELLGEITTTSSSASSFASGAGIVVVDLEPKGHTKALRLLRRNGKGIERVRPVSRLPYDFERSFDTILNPSPITTIARSAAILMREPSVVHQRSPRKRIAGGEPWSAP